MSKINPDQLNADLLVLEAEIKSIENKAKEMNDRAQLFTGPENFWAKNILENVIQDLQKASWRLFTNTDKFK